MEDSVEVVMVGSALHLRPSMRNRWVGETGDVAA